MSHPLGATRRVVYTHRSAGERFAAPARAGPATVKPQAAKSP